MPTHITPERPDTPDATALIEELEAELAPLYPSASRHGYSVQKLLDEDVKFFIVREDGAPAGCGGVKLVGDDYGELKRMYIRPAFRGRGLAKLLLDHLTEFVRERELKSVRLETGIHQHAAIGLYERAGFVQIPPFGPYREDIVSRCYERRLT